MEKKAKPKIIFLPKTEKSIFQIKIYIAEQGNPETAEKFADELYEFGYSLANIPLGYPPCRQPQLARQNMRCAIFHKNYIFVYKVVKNTIVIFNVIHSKTNPLFYSV